MEARLFFNVNPFTSGLIYGTSGVIIGLFPGKLAFQVCVMYLFRSSNVFSIHLTDTYDAQEEKNGFLARIIQIFMDFWRP